MEGNLSSGSIMPRGSSYGGHDLQGSTRINHQQNPHSLQQQQGSISMHDAFPLSMGQIHDCEQSDSVVDFNKGDRGKNSASDEDEQSFNEDGIDGQNDSGKAKKVPLWHRVKWTDSMVRLLITAVSYIGEDAASECGPGGRRKYANLQKKGKWKSVSKVMAERGFYVSPQQCEDKFNDLNKRYKKLNEILGRGTSCRVVENPSLLDMMDHLSEKMKDEVRKILSSKHLFYEEMCSYHNGNRLHLPPDPALQRSLQLALRSRDDPETSDSRRHTHSNIDEDDQDEETDDLEEYEEDHSRGTYGVIRDAAKRLKQGQGHENFSFGNHVNSEDFNKSLNLQSHNPLADMNLIFSEGPKDTLWQKQWIDARSIELEQQKLQIDIDMLELKKERFKWKRFSQKKDQELKKMKIENERMQLENDRMALELKQMEMSMRCNQ
ncbi:hypothetical protein Ancab_036280 [Ancistrocladus abbreviatus]